mmetsp:Transcript_4869/g.9645  ORF Transcript_4869/g.9645 Transcript_4869/m.9645 type:complete len:116 (+) Transcript_4869:526-873(+)
MRDIRRNLHTPKQNKKIVLQYSPHSHQNGSAASLFRAPDVLLLYKDLKRNLTRESAPVARPCWWKRDNSSRISMESGIPGEDDGMVVAALSSSCDAMYSPLGVVTGKAEGEYNWS